jgi:hypothetical protein
MKRDLIKADATPIHKQACSSSKGFFTFNNGQLLFFTTKSHEKLICAVMGKKLKKAPLKMLQKFHLKC